MKGKAWTTTQRLFSTTLQISLISRSIKRQTHLGEHPLKARHVFPIFRSAFQLPPPIPLLVKCVPYFTLDKMISQFTWVCFVAGMALSYGNAAYDPNPYNNYPPQQYPNYPQQQQQFYNGPQQQQYYNNIPHQQYTPTQYQPQYQQPYQTQPQYQPQPQYQQQYQPQPQQYFQNPQPPRQQVKITTPAPATGVARQFFSLDDHGYSKYGYSHPGQASETYMDPNGNQVGSYAYFDAEGKEVRVSYVADENGFRIVSKNNADGSPVSNAAAVTPVEDTPEVAEAKAAHLKAVEEAKRLATSTTKPRSRTQSTKKTKKTFDYEDEELADWL